MANEIIERVKLAIAYKCQFAINANAPYAKIMFYEAAKAAIKAMREPTDEMILACKDFGITLNYQAMIDAALNEKPSPKD